MTSTEKKMRLNALDHLPHPNYSHSILYLSLRTGVSSKTAFEILQKGLQRTFTQLPWLGGKVQLLSPDSPGSLEVRYSSEELLEDAIPSRLKYKELGDDVTYEDVRESAFHPTVFPDASLTWAPFLPNMQRGTEVFVAQANFLEGACLLASAMCHVVGDGVAVNAVLKIWSENCERFQLGLATERLQPEISNHELLETMYAEHVSMRSGKAISPTRWRLLGLAPPDQASSSIGEDSQPMDPEEESYKPELQACLFYMSSDKVAELRETCRRAANDASLSFNDAICALIWRGLLRARVGAREAAGISTRLEAEARLDLPFDCRAYFPEAVPAAYLGNFTMINQVLQPLEVMTEPSSAGLASVAGAIRGVAGGVSAAGLMDAYGLVKARTGGERSLTLENLRVNGNGLIITSFATFATDSISFGGSAFGNGGRPDAVRSMMGDISKVFRYCAILPKKSNGGIEFVATVADEEMGLLLSDKEFSKYALFVS